MGYFSNGAEGEGYVEQWCCRCEHWDEGGCPVWLAHQIHNYAECNKPDSILHMLIPRQGISNARCEMFIEARASGDLFAAQTSTLPPKGE
jgi:hypothetical protein